VNAGTFLEHVCPAVGCPGKGQVGVGVDLPVNLVIFAKKHVTAQVGNHLPAEMSELPYFEIQIQI